MVGQRNLPALLPAAEGEQISFALCGEFTDVDPEAGRSIVGIQLYGIIRHSLVIYAIKLISLIGAAEAVIRQLGAGYAGVIPVGRHILAIAAKRIIRHQSIAHHWRHVLGSVQIRYLLGG